MYGLYKLNGIQIYGVKINNILITEEGGIKIKQNDTLVLVERKALKKRIINHYLECFKNNISIPMK